MKVFEIHQQIAEKRKAAEALVAKAVTEDRDMSDDENDVFAQLQAAIATLTDLASKMQAVEGGEDAPVEEASEVPARKSKPIAFEGRTAPAVHTKKHMFMITRAAQQWLKYGHLKDGVEKELSDDVAQRTGKAPQGFYFPTGSEYRTLLNTTTGTGSVATILAQDYIEMLRNKSVVLGLGAKQLTQMSGQFSIPRQNGAGSAYWVTEGNAPTTSNQTTEAVAFTAKTLGAYTDVSRKFLLLANMDGEAFVRDDLTKVHAIEIDRVTINGSGSGAEPTGILQNSSCPTITIASDTNGAALDWTTVVALEKSVAAANAILDEGTCAYLGNAQVRAQLKSIQKASNTARYLMDEDGKVNGYNFAYTQNVPSNLTKGSGTGLNALIFGDFSQVVWVTWGGLDVMVDPYTGSSAGTVRIVVLQDTDLKLRHPESFAKCVSALG